MDNRGYPRKRQTSTASPAEPGELPWRLELKVMKTLGNPQIGHCMNYLRATGKPLCLLLNFGRPRIEIRRVTAGV